MAEQSGKPITGVRLRVYGSGTGFHRAQAHRLAAELEETFGMDGSAIFEQDGRWDGESEPGYVIEMVFDNHGAGLTMSPAADAYVWQGRKGVKTTLDVAHKAIQAWRSEYPGQAPTFYVTADLTQAIEVF